MALTEQTDQVAQALVLLVEQYKDKPILSALIASYVTQIQELEAASFDVLSLQDLDVQSGAQLDLIGSLVGQPRDGRLDGPYRQFIKARILLNRASGTRDDILSLLALLETGTEPYTMVEEDPAANIVIQFYEALTDTDTMNALAEIVIRAKAAGVAIEVRWYSDVDTFRFATSDATETDAAKGFGDDTLPGPGGVLSTARGSN